eukprot:2944784-Lingulodinium_polyedra.AAC.1
MASCPANDCAFGLLEAGPSGQAWGACVCALAAVRTSICRIRISKPGGLWLVGVPEEGRALRVAGNQHPRQTARKVQRARPLARTIRLCSRLRVFLPTVRSMVARHDGRPRFGNPVPVICPFAALFRCSRVITQA